MVEPASVPSTVFAPTAAAVAASNSAVLTPIAEMVRILQQAHMFNSQRLNSTGGVQRGFSLLQLMQEQANVGK
ncbi:unnamed protein product [Onchocerca flexuosa]|uniref:Killing trait domain-containing protein n=1 Tax=Onchocerca flexuosa TaxID=387005 RepID=A0A183HIH4_9BILA|nr:unnamed protein product [Onchocerca flexuosa]